MASSESEEDRLIRQQVVEFEVASLMFFSPQRLKAALHYAVGRACEDVGRANKITFTREVIAAITETTFHKCEAVSTELQLFAKHAKRTTINTDDVKLICRKNEQLHSFLSEEEGRLKAAKVKEGNETTKGKSKKPVKKKDQPTLIIDDDSN